MTTQVQAPVGHRFRSVCDACHQAKMKCSRGNPCNACAKSGQQCQYSISSRLGRPPRNSANSNKRMSGSSRVKQQTHGNLVQLPLAADDTSLVLDDMFPDALSGAETPKSVSSASPSHKNFHPSQDIAQTNARSVVNYDSSTNRKDISPELCHCLERHVRLLCHLKHLDRTHHSSVISVTLDAGKRGLLLWHSHLECRACSKGQVNSALCISIMNIGMVIRRLWRFFLEHQTQHVPNSSVPSPERARIPFSQIRFDAIRPKNTFAESVSSIHDSQDTAAIRTRPRRKMSVSELQVSEEEQIFVAGMLMVRMLCRIKEVVRASRSKIEQDFSAYGTEGQDHHIQDRFIPSMLDDLEESARQLEQSLKQFIMT